MDPSCGTSVLLPVHRWPGWAQCDPSCFLLAFRWGKSGAVSFGKGFARSPGLLGLLCSPSLSLGGHKVGTKWVQMAARAGPGWQGAALRVSFSSLSSPRHNSLPDPD